MKSINIRKDAMGLYFSFKENGREIYWLLLAPGREAASDEIGDLIYRWFNGIELEHDDLMISKER